ncbi:MAG TPA: MAPEG family protein [Pseudomonadales bacterium]|nr:MAPEG family protein [Pseudomonadales bacterium]
MTMPLVMTLADWCILVAGLGVPFVFTIYAKASKDFDNSKPRDYMERIEGARKRAYWAVQNGQETFPLFAVAVLLAERAAVAQANVNMIAAGFVACRLVYGLMYVLDKATLRSVVWMASIACIVTLFVMAA